MTNHTRRISEFLPEVLQTDVVKKFFAATGDHLFQPDRVEYLNAYIGQKPLYYDPKKDQYVSEISKDRTDYQVDPVAVSRNSQNNSITHCLFYDDLVNKLRFQGALVNDHNRLFDGEYYSWGLPVDLDKFVNYQSYVWLPTGPAAITLLSATSASNIQTLSTYTYTGFYQRSNSDDIVDGQQQPLTFSSGLKIKFSLDDDVGIRNTEFIVEGVGRRILLVADSFQSFLAWENPEFWDSSVWDGNPLLNTPNYVLIARGSENQNPWSYGNRWFHKSILTISGTPVSNINSASAQRPILEFHRTIKLWNFASRSRGFVNLIDTVTTDINQVIGKTAYVVDGVPLDDNMTVLFTNLRDPGNTSQLDTTTNNKIYAVTNLRNQGRIVLQLIANGDDATGSARDGDGVWILQGAVDPSTGNSNANTCWYFSNNRWILGQSRQLPEEGSSNYAQILNQSPLFELFDTDGNSLADPSVWPGSSFAGCTLLQYARDPHGTVDPELGFAPVIEDLSARNFVFEVSCVTGEWDYAVLNTRASIPGFKFWQEQSAESQPQYLNNWYVSNFALRQSVVNQYVSTANQQKFDIDQMPLLSAPGLPAISVTVGTSSKQLGVDYELHDGAVNFSQPLEAGQFVQIKTWAGLNNTASNGYFEIPLNLQANPNNREISRFSIANVLDHLTSVIANQTGFEGQAQGINNWRDSEQDQSVGAFILQHRAPLLKLMGLNSVDQTDVFDSSSSVVDPFSAIQWAQSEYLRFYNKFINSLLNIYDGGGLTAANSAQQWLQTALARINVGKTKSSAWANSGFDLTNGAYCSQQSSDPTWVPTSATRLGAAPSWEPVVFFDTSQPLDSQTGQYPLTMRCHNGALLVLKDFNNQNLGSIANNQTRTRDPNQLTHPVARAWMLFEVYLYQSLPPSYRDANSVPALDPRTVFSGKYRQTSYSRQDQLRIQNPSWQKWLTFNQIDAFRNTTFDINNAFTWNYSSCVDRDQQPVPGHYRGIYFYYYDTDTPHETPWAMLGFSQKPDWWEQQYGPAPYTSGNLAMWEDLRDGRVAQGPREGFHQQWARPALLDVIPVDSVGNLLPPFLAGIVTSLPSTVDASADWKFGDRGPIENVWLTTADSDFLLAQWSYLTKPAQFIEYLWDGPRQKKIFANQRYSQWISTDTLSRKSSSEYYVHRENPQDVLSLPAGTSTYYGSCGIQQWISERLISDSRSVTEFFGNLVRGLDSNLGHRMGGFTDGRNMRLLVDSFGLSSNDSLLLPQEDLSTILLRSASTGEYFYSGVIIEYKGNQGWRVIGYDSVNPVFVVIPSDTRGPRNTVVVDNQRVIEYKLGLNTTQSVPYGTVFATRQEVYDFLISLGRAQASSGWTFDQYDSTASQPRNWSLSAREFLFWSQGPWAPGTYIALSPLASLAKFRTSSGIIQNVGGVVNGAYSILDRNGVSININNVDFLRIDDEISVRTLNDQGIYGLRLYTTTLEHAFVFNNSTIFNDTVYNPLFNQRQSRFKLYGFRTLDWNGRLQAPGYMVTQTLTTINNVLTVSNQIIPNFEKSANDLRKLFEIDLATPYQTVNDPTNVRVSSISQSIAANLGRLAKHTIGYQSRPYLTDLLVDDNVAFQFYQGMIGQKGTPISVDKLLRNTNVVAPEEDFYYFEEFAFRSSIFGYANNTSSVDLQLISTQVQSNPQLIEIPLKTFGDIATDDVISYVPGDSRIVTSTPVVQPFVLRQGYQPLQQDLPTAGYVLLDEVDYSVVDQEGLLSLYGNQIDAILQDPTKTTVQPDNLVWQFIHPTRGWDIYRLIKLDLNITSVVSNAFDNALTTITTDVAHKLSDGDIVIVFGVVNAGVNIDNTFVVEQASAFSFNIQINVSGNGSGGTIWLYRSIRFLSVEERDSANIPGGWRPTDLAYVDGTDQTASSVWRFLGNRWNLLRTSTRKTDPLSVGASLLYNLTTKSTITYLTLWDPAKNRIPGIVDREISFKTLYDPARYTNDPSGTIGINPDDCWGNDQVGTVWWDLSTTRFLDYEIGTDSYRRQHWGAVAPGTSIDIYEWVRSTVPPASWKTLVAAGTDLSAIGSTNRPSGQVKNDQIPYVARQQLNSLGQLQTVYYFWVKQTNTVPDVPGRSLSTSTMSAVIAQPQNFGIAWWAPISENMCLLGNVGSLLEADLTVWQINWSQTPAYDNEHKEYVLVRPNDPRSNPDQQLWIKMRDSLVEFDNVGNSVPDLRLRPIDQLGIQNRPIQTMFEDANIARKTLVDLVNTLLTNSDQPPASDAGRSQYLLNLFDSKEPEPSNMNQLEAVYLATTSHLQSYYTNGFNGVGAQLISTTPVMLTIDQQNAQLQQRVLVKDQIDPIQNGIYDVVSNGCAVTNINISGNSTSIGNVLQLQGTLPGVLIVNNQDVFRNQRLLLTAQTNDIENGLWVVLQPGNDSTAWLLQKISSIEEAEDNPLSTSWILQRSWDFDSADRDLTGAQVSVLDGATQASTVWNQTNPDVNQIGVDAIRWQLGPAATVWDQRVDNLAQLRALDYLVNNGTKVLVAAAIETSSRWTIWQWNLDERGLGDWTQLRVQSYVTPLYWSYTDWYAANFDNQTVPDLTFDTLTDRNNYLDFVSGQIVKVNNTGSGNWAIYQYTPGINQDWTVVAEQNGNIQLSDALWDYATYGMGFDGSGFATDYQGFEYDSRQELQKIVDGLWVGARGTSGLLKIDDQRNEPNQLFFAMINLVLATQNFVDWAFKTSFVNLRGFAQTLLPTPYYTTNKINSLLEYVNETKPYHVKIRQFVDWRKANDLYQSNSTDFDKPPYDDPVKGMRILDPQSSLDQQILKTNSYINWFNNYQTNPALIRRIRTRMLIDRISCSSEWWYAPGWDEQTPAVDQTVSSLVEWIQLIQNGSTPENTVVEVQIVDVTLLRRNTSNSSGLLNWDQIEAGLSYSGPIDIYIRSLEEVFELLDAVVPVGYTAAIKIDNLTTANRYRRNNQQTETLQDWELGAYQHLMGAVDRINSSYRPTAGMPPANSEFLISGCASKLTGLDGADFSNQDSWDKSFWDNVRGWDYSEDAFDIYDQNISGGAPVGYWIYKGNGIRKQFGLPKASQDPNNLKVWVDGLIKTAPRDWFVNNWVSQALVANGGLGYTFNDQLQLVGGTYYPPIDRLNASFEIVVVNGLGAAEQIHITNGGQGFSVGDQITLSGGSATQAAQVTINNVNNVGSITGITVANGGAGYTLGDSVSAVWAPGTAPLIASPARFRVSGVDFLGRITSVTIEDPGRYMMVPNSNVVAVSGGTGINATVNVLWGGRMLEFVSAPGEPTVSRPNVWIVENGSTFVPAVSSILDVAFDGARLNRPDLEGGHPEELNKIWPRSTVYYDIYTVPSGGWGNVETRTYQGDGISDTFDIGQDITIDSQLFVYVNGALKTWGFDQDYVINYQGMKVVFANGAPVGKISIISVGFGGASKSLGSYTIGYPGRDYNLFDLVTLTGGLPSAQNAQVQITAVKAVDIQIVDGGENYLVGDTLLYKFGLGSQTLTVSVTGVTASGTKKGIITSVNIELAGYYTNLNVGANEWYSNGVGSGAVLEPSWGAANVFVVNRGLYYQEPLALTQLFVTPVGALPATGNGLVMGFGHGRIREQIRLEGNGVQDSVTLTAGVAESQLLVTWNGETFVNYGFDSTNNKVLVLNQVPQLGDVVYVTVYNSSLYSLNRIQKFEVTLPTLDYQLQNPPGILPAASKNVLVYKNGTKLRAPYFWQGQGDGVSTTFNLGVLTNLGWLPSSAASLTVWADAIQLSPFDYDLNPLNQEEIIFFFGPPPAGTNLIVQIADVGEQNYDYLINVDQISLSSWAVSGGETITVVTYSEDSQTSIVNDQFDGNSAGVYVLTQTPSVYGSIQAFVNGVLYEQNWDYTVSKAGNNTVISFGSQYSHVFTDLIEINYSTRLPAVPGVALRQFKNIYDDVSWMRLSDSSSTRLTQPLLWNSESAVVADGSCIPDASPRSPGAVWIGAERMEYTQKIAFANEAYPNQVKLVGLNRGSLGTPGGINTRFVSESYSGNGQAAFFTTSFDDPYVFVNDLLQLKDRDYQLVSNPPSLAPGLYVKFATDHIPPVGSQNVRFVKAVASLTTSDVSSPAGTLVRDASANQAVPAGYIWPMGNQGIQYSNEPQTAFLLAEPGSRLE